MSISVPTTIFTGFLGSGKSTIILPLIEHLQATDHQVIYIKNEIGEVDVDAKLMAGENIISRELLNGCICCTLVGPFIAAAEEIVQTYHPDRIIIEASGAADPSAIALMVSSHPDLYRDGVISVVDVINFQGYTDLSLTAQRQASFTDLIVFNKVEQVDLDQKRAVVGYVRELNNHSPIIEAPAGKVDPEAIFGLSTTKLDVLLAANHDKSDHAHHLADEQIETFTCSLQQPISEEKFLEMMANLPKQVFRVKGFVQLTNEQMRIVNKVGSRTELDQPPPNLGFRPSQLVFIGFKIKSWQEEICQQLQQTT